MKNNTNEKKEKEKIKKFRVRSKQRIATRLSHRLIIVSSLGILLLTVSFGLYFNLSNTQSAYGSVAGDFRSAATGNWSTAATWQRFNGTSWVTATVAPSSSDGTITIQNGHTITLNTNVTVDQVIINTGGTVVLVSGKIVTIASGSGIDFDVSGIFKNAGTVTFNTGANMTFENGGKYQHNFTTTAGTIPTATWNTGSTCEIIGYTTFAVDILGVNQSFYNFTWNCPSQTSASQISLGGLLSVVNGDFSVVSTGAGDLELAYTVNSNTSIYGSFIQSGGTFILNDLSGTSVLNLKGNINITGGTFEEGPGTGSVNFSGTSVQTYTKTGGTISGGINFSILNNSTVDFGTSLLNGSSGTFNVNSGGGIATANANGLANTALSGSIQVTGSRTYNTGADYTYNGSVAQITGDGLPATVHNLTANNFNNLTLTNTVSVSNLLSLNGGKIITNSNEIKVTNTGTAAITGYSLLNYVVGNLRRNVTGNGAYDFPVGSTANSELASLTFTGMTGVSNILAKFTKGNPIQAGLPLSGIVVNGTSVTDMLNYGYWTMTPNTTMTGGSYSVTLNELGHTNPAPSPASYCVLKRSDLTMSWQSQGTHNNNTQSVNNGVVIAKRSSLSAFSDFGIGFSGTGALPIELIYFSAKLTDQKQVDLFWSTASEINNDYFSIERSSDGSHFETLLTKPGAGNSSVVLFYKATDENPLNGFSYYRLKQTDFDGHFSYSKTEIVKKEENDKNNSDIKIISLFPNPFDKKFSVNYNLEGESEATFLLLNLSGQIINKGKIIAGAGNQAYDYTDDKNLPPGIYFVKIEGNHSSAIQKIIKK